MYPGGFPKDHRSVVSVWTQSCFMQITHTQRQRQGLIKFEIKICLPELCWNRSTVRCSGQIRYEERNEW